MMHLRQCMSYGLLLMIGVSVFACTPTNDIVPTEAVPTQPPMTQTETLTSVPTAVASEMPTGVPSVTFPPTLTPSLTPTPAPPTGTAPPPPTPGPFEYSIQPGDDCFSILAKHGHRTPDALQQFYELNNLPGQCLLPGPGAVVLVPRPVEGGVVVGPSPTPPIPWDGNSLIAVTQYCAEDGDTLTSIALKNDTTLRKICELNPLPDGLDCTGCDFSESDTGSCPRAPIISVAQCVNVPGATPTPSNTAPPSGDETPTMTPTYAPPVVLGPTSGAVVSGSVRLQWVSVGVLSEGQFYVVRVTNQATGELYSEKTKATSLLLPVDLFSGVGGTQEFSWYVSIESLSSNGLLVPTGGRTIDNTFNWRSED